MKIWTVGLLFSGLALLAGSAWAQEDLRRFKLMPFTEMTPAQRAYADAVMSGPVAATGSAAVVPGAGTIGSPFNVYLRSPALAERLRQMGEQIRFRSSLPARLNELAILVTARHWTAQYEWYAHHRLALKAGLSPAVAEDLAQGRRPAGMQEDEAIVYNFSHELHNQHAVSDATFKAAVDKFGEQGVVDLIAVNGYYVLVSMILNVDRTPIPGGSEPPLPLLK
ncbi:MAG: carboxymuconolactone decarboxylase family protein [Betaproteobacteria bacterium]|nr:MAG: carboxymuconolactone decarboxylase family protein [Betaproteobacteria bacterium]